MKDIRSILILVAALALAVIVGGLVGSLSLSQPTNLSKSSEAEAMELLSESDKALGFTASEKYYFLLGGAMTALEIQRTGEIPHYIAEVAWSNFTAMRWTNFAAVPPASK